MVREVIILVVLNCIVNVELVGVVFGFFVMGFVVIGEDVGGFIGEFIGVLVGD